MYIFLKYVNVLQDGGVTNAKFPASVTFENADDLVNDTLYLRVRKKKDNF